MFKDISKNSLKLSIIIKTVLMGLMFTLIPMVVFALLMYSLQIKYEYSSLFGTLSVAIGLFVSSFLTAKKKAKNGMVTGLIIGVIAFLLVFVISLILNGGGITYNTLFHLIIFVLSSVIGGILGVNKAVNKKYI